MKMGVCGKALAIKFVVNKNNLCIFCAVEACFIGVNKQ
jgi:hypothetical protein